MVVLLGKGDRGVLIAHPHAQGGGTGTDRQLSITELAGEIKRLHRRLLTRQSQRVLGHLRLDALAHRTRRPEEPVGRSQAFQPLMGALEVVVLDKQTYPSLAVLEVGEHRPREQLLP
jgi:hypothetical protein